MLIEFTFFSCAKSMFYDIDSIIVLLKKYKNKIERCLWGPKQTHVAEYGDSVWYAPAKKI